MVVGAFLGSRVMAVEDVSSEEVPEAKVVAVREHCDTIKDELRALQRSDSKARVYLGRYYETIIGKFITPLNVRLVENGLSSTSFINNQNDFNKTRTNFVIDYIEYQKGLEELVAMDCKVEPKKFYEKIVNVRARRAVVAEDVVRFRKLAERHVGLVEELEAKL